MPGRFRKFVMALVLVPLVIVVVGCGNTTEDELDGTWVGPNTELAGPGFNETWTFGDGKIIVNDGDHAAWTYKVDATKKPKQIDLTMPDGKTGMGIYKIEKDTLTICHIMPNRGKADAKRPEEFDMAKRDDVVVRTLLKKEEATGPRGNAAGGT